LNSSTGEIEGTPVNSCCGYFLTFKATDTHGQSDSRTLTINLQAPLSVSTLTLGDGMAGSTYFGTLFANGNYTTPLTWQISGGPVGLEINSSNGSFLTSSPAYVLRQGGQFTLNAQVTDSSMPQQTASRNISLNVHTLDQQIFGGVGANENLASTRRIAQVFRASTTEPLQGVRAAGLTCTSW
jgi:hypothetical protein